MQKEAVAIISGGMDSATLLYRLLAENYLVHALSFDYGQRHRKELDHAAVLCREKGVDHKIVSLANLSPLLQGSALTTPNIEVPHGHYADETMKLTVVPNRNAVMLAIAFAYAVSLKAERVAIGVHAGDHPIYPDCRPEFIEAFGKMEKIATEGYAHPELHLDAPFLNISKADIVKQGVALGVPYEKTWSCYEGKDKHCGKCGTCVERKEAFQLAGVIDPTEYD